MYPYLWTRASKLASAVAGNGASLLLSVLSDYNLTISFYPSTIRSVSVTILIVIPTDS